jgi:hypothetical protein
VARYHYEHVPCDTFVAAFDDKTGLIRSEVQMDDMIQRMRDVANTYGFDLQVWGSWATMKKVLSNG